MIAPPRIWGVTLDWEGADPHIARGGSGLRPPPRAEGGWDLGGAAAVMKFVRSQLLLAPEEPCRRWMGNGGG